MDKYEKTLDDLNKALEIKPNSETTLNDRGVTYQVMTRNEELLEGLNNINIKKCDKQSDFLNELKRYDVEKYGIETYGISYDPEKNRYMIIFDYAGKGNLGKYYTTLKLMQKVEILFLISDNLNHIHKQNYIHSDLYSEHKLIINDNSKNIEVKYKL
ncbi:hypothetical protein C2G38_2163824 [Gigaspora rosea]|uniref:Protein kinase domain-containing protein n=1 Tax=Gigaspora rosea TaxID=44941 RepID=A0A397VWQ8_9GLOM|nr:hypothetical protein C2G38_2163824 [Gigaspora rosea]